MTLSEQLAEIGAQVKELEREIDKLRRENKLLRFELKALESKAVQSDAPWAVLGVEESASEAEIGKAFRVLSRRFHPDNRDTGSSEKFQQLLTARTAMLSKASGRR